jgi:hypothetical protein
LKIDRDHGHRIRKPDRRHNGNTEQIYKLMKEKGVEKKPPFDAITTLIVSANKNTSINE